MKYYFKNNGKELLEELRKSKYWNNYIGPKVLDFAVEVDVINPYNNIIFMPMPIWDEEISKKARENNTIVCINYLIENCLISEKQLHSDNFNNKVDEIL